MLPIASVLAQLINFLLAFIVLFVVLLIFRAEFSPWLWLLPFVILIQTCFTLGIALDFECPKRFLPRCNDDHGRDHAGLVFFDARLL